MTSRHVGEAGVGQVREGARERILDTAYDLFSHNGIGSVGIDRIIAEAGIAKATLYRHFPSKEVLVLAFLELREQRWTHEWLETQAESIARTPQERVLCVFDVLDEWFHRADFEGCSFIKALLEVDEPDSPIHRAAARHLAEVRRKLQLYAQQAGAREPEEMGYQLQVVMMGAIVSAGRGDVDAACRARVFVERLLQSSA
jgi:AcrR family transcriptional regulator